jgi:hypothetical protein
MKRIRGVNVSDVPVAVLEKRQNDDTIKKCIVDLVERRPCVKGDYRLLNYYFLKDYCNIRMSFKDFETLRHSPSPETISRRMRELKEKDPMKYGASEETEIKRFKRFKVMRDHYGSKHLNDFMEGE